MADEQRRRFTLTELFVCIVLFGLIVALLAPNMDGGRERARLATCYNNLRQLAMANIETATQGSQASFGGYLEPLRVSDDAAFPDEDPSTPEREIMVAWPTKLLPTIEQVMLHERIFRGDKNFNLNSPPMIEIFYCPSDPPVDPAGGILAYVANSGMPDLAAASEDQPSDLRANGVFHDQRPGRFGPQVRLGRDLKDGSSTTILLSENIHRDPAGSASQPGNTWLRPAAGAANLEQWYGMVWVVDPQNPRSPQASLEDRFNRDTRPESQRDQPYAASGTRFARPSSEHPDVFNVAFCEGNTKEISQDIDYAVYQQLMTPDGRKAAPGDAPNQPFEKTLPETQRFMNPPLMEADY
ncbi:DUF1559 family PulG-like putative transporter [Lacipirellula limnantheis]|uniref:DUF1559 domain-containing protein n=1 Tax=Lacipirellula limnantheis TaxID=2528024 RepID=A0A517TS33_9BACT|nr:DUF1559 domain-containing protein [Lacipirellula limnantheis]QDT71186.1 hypothetical protein I41_03410 [Lacipirellula limnantheis]